MIRRPPLLLMSLLVAAALPATCLVAADAPLTFNRDIRPILSDKCFRCHGPDRHQRKADLRLDEMASATAAHDGRRAIVPKNLDKSELVKRITAVDPEDRMPPADSGVSLTGKEIDTLKRWIAEGAGYEAHWAFIPPKRPPLPTIKRADWPRNAIDYFVLSKLEREGLAPSPEASKEALIRRVTFDLTGLPPTVEEIDAFLADTSPQAYERVVDRLLKSPRYGEHMARYWLDAARYADTNGYQYDTERTQWVWRDWVIHAYNTNKPFDEFTIEQLAGDLLPGATDQQRIATAFNRNHGITIEGGVIDEEYRTEYVIDRLTTTATVWMGLTFGCGRCHDHKYDPITQDDFYSFFAFFNQVPERGLNGFDPRIKAPSILAGDEERRIDERIAVVKETLSRARVRVAPQLAQWEQTVKASVTPKWDVLDPTEYKSTGGTTFTKLDDKSLLSGPQRPNKDVYEITARTDATNITAIQLQALTHPSLPGGGPGRYGNSNFVLSEFEAEAVSVRDPSMKETVKFVAATADYSQQNFDITAAIDGQVGLSNGWAVDGPTRKQDCTAVFVPSKPIGFEGGSELRFRLRFESQYGYHAIGRARLSATTSPVIALPDDVKQIVAVDASKRNVEQNDRLLEYFLAQHAPTDTPAETLRAVAELNQLRQQRAAADDKTPATMVMAELAQPRDTFVLNRGEYDKRGHKVSPGVPNALGALPSDAKGNRLDLARWLVAPENPLTARVAVNRYWQLCFGTGIVKTAEDFGSQGDWPSHPDLLDWLAVEFISPNGAEHPWDIKHIQRLIVTSATYRQSSNVTPDLLARDPENRLLAHGPRVRLDAEVVRDMALYSSGLLIERLGGPSVYPYHPQGLWLEINNRPGYSRAYPHQTDPSQLYRRSLYTFWKRTVPPPSMQTFDAPEREYCVLRRSRTNTPLQAFVMLHDPQMVEASRRLAERMMKEGGADVDSRITFGFRTITARRPSAEELSVLRDVYVKRLAQYRADKDAAVKLLSVGESKRDDKLDVAEHAAWSVVARMLLNLSEAITKS